MRLDVKGLRPTRLPLTLTREFVILMDTLSLCRKQEVKAETLSKLANDLITDTGFSENNIWTDAFRTMLKHYLAETLNARRPIGDFLDYIYDASRDIKQFEHIDPQHILISTMHSAKGLEFPAVIIAGQPLPNEKAEDERRLYYVSMTRAMKRLCCLFCGKQPHRFIGDFAHCGEQHIEMTDMQPVITAEDKKALRSLIWDTDLGDVIISYPVYPGIAKNAQTILAALEPGACKNLKLINNKFIYQSYPIAMLSKQGMAKYQQKIDQGYEAKKITFLAAIKWKIKESETFQNRETKEIWYTGLFQVLFRSFGDVHQCINRQS